MRKHFERKLDFLPTDLNKYVFGAHQDRLNDKVILIIGFGLEIIKLIFK